MDQEKLRQAVACRGIGRDGGAQCLRLPPSLQGCDGTQSPAVPETCALVACALPPHRRRGKRHIDCLRRWLRKPDAVQPGIRPAVRPPTVKGRGEAPSLTCYW